MKKKTTVIIPSWYMVEDSTEELIELFDYGVDIKDVFRTSLEAWCDLIRENEIPARRELKEFLKQRLKDNIIEPMLTSDTIHADTVVRLETFMLDKAVQLFEVLQLLPYQKNSVFVSGVYWLDYDMVLEIANKNITSDNATL